MKAIVLGGFLGTGKTSVLLQLIDYLMKQPLGSDKSVASDKGDSCGALTQNADATVVGTKVAVVENEIGEVGIDGSVLSGAGFAMRELVSGCICCSLAGELATTIRVLQWQLNPQWLVVEATGLAYPEKVAESVRAGAAQLESLKLVVLVDAARFRNLEAVSPLTDAQLPFADVLVLNKVDLVDTAELDFVRERLRSLNSGAKIIEVTAIQPLPEDFFTLMTTDASSTTNV
jgi:G3E family GTPase